MDPLVSIIIPLYNYSRFVGDCIQSILDQDYDHLEIIVVDDKSDDNPTKIIDKFKSDKLKLLVHPSNLGYSAAKNTGIIASNGEFITILDADDMLASQSISKRVEVLLASQVQLVYADVIAIYDNFTYRQCLKLKHIPERDANSSANRIPHKLHFSSPYDMHAQTVMVSRELYHKYGLYDEKLRSRSDREMWWRFFGKCKEDDPRLVTREYIPLPVAFYRYHQNSMMSMRRRNKHYDRKVRALAEQLYTMRRTDGITPLNTKMLES
jgi:glycosyltransferase involved in cell wall biosynthesis